MDKQDMSKMKVAKSIRILGGADGPTAVFWAGVEEGNKKKKMKEKITSWQREKRKKRVIRTLKADSHSFNEVIRYAGRKWKYEILSVESEEYECQYRELRTALLLQHRPDLLGKQAELPPFDGYDEESLKLYLDRMEAREMAARKVPAEAFDIQLCVLKKQKGDSESIILLENNYKYLATSCSGSKRDVKYFDQIYKDIVRFYGVSQKDIDEENERYRDLVSVLVE